MLNGSHGECLALRVQVRDIPEPLDVPHKLSTVLNDEFAFRPSFADDEIFEVEVERRFLLRYKCIRRTKPVTIDQVRTGHRECPVIHTTQI